MFNRIALIVALLFPTFAGAATINVNSTMSEATIQGLINGGTSGDTVVFAAGTYNLASNGGNSNNAALVAKAGLTYTGPTSGSPAHFVATGGYPLMYFSGTTVSIQYLTFDTGVLFIEDHTTSATIDNNTFQNQQCGTTASAVNAIFVNGGINSSDISFNTFLNIGASCFTHFVDDMGAGGITMYAFHAVTITHNTFTNVIEGIDIPDEGGGGYDGASSTINDNTATGIHRIFIEILGTGTIPSGLEVARNNWSNPLNPWAVNFCLSLTAGLDMIVHDNVCNGNLNTPSASPYGIEIAGVSTQAYNNIVEGYFESGFAIGNTGSGGISITNNHICGPTMFAGGSGSGSTPVVGNANGFLSWEDVAQGSGPYTGNTTSNALICGGSPTVTSIAIHPGTPPTIHPSVTQPFTCTATYSDSSTAPCTSPIWASSIPANASVNSSTGVALGVAVGSTVINATASGKTSNNVTLTVTSAPANQPFEIGAF